MSYLLTFTLIISLKGVTSVYSPPLFPLQQSSASSSTKYTSSSNSNGSGSNHGSNNSNNSNGNSNNTTATGGSNGGSNHNHGNTPRSALTSSISSQQQHQQPQQRQSDCGVRPARRQPRNFNGGEQFFYNIGRIPKIIAGSPTKEGQFPWQASLELLHPSMGFLGHWCGGVLIHQYWVLSAAHCVHNDLFNLPLPPLWTVVLGEYDRKIESGYEQRIPVEKIVLHQSYQNFLHDLVMMKLSMPADLSQLSNIRKVCLPFVFDEKAQSSLEYPDPEIYDFGSFEKDDNFLRRVKNKSRPMNITFPSMKELLTAKITNRLKQNQQYLEGQRQQSGKQLRGEKIKQERPRSRSKRRNQHLKGSGGRQHVPNQRRNDKIMAGFDDDASYDDFAEAKHGNLVEYNDLPYIDCVATGWGKSNVTGDLTDILLKTNVPLHSSSRCKEAYGSFVKVHRGHLCAGKLNGKGGTCVGDSGGPLQCRLTKNGPWILAGITSFGSGCALEGFPDVYTRTSFYMKWILDTINSE